MNSLNIITSRVSPASSASPSRTNSLTSMSLELPGIDEKLHDAHQGESKDDTEPFPDTFEGSHNEKPGPSEQTPLLSEGKDASEPWHTSRAQWLPRRMLASVINSLRWFLSTLASPGVYLIACFYDDDDVFAPMSQLKKLFGVYPNSRRKEAYGNSEAHSNGDSSDYNKLLAPPANARPGTSSSMSSESESDHSLTPSTHSRHTRSKSLQPSEEGGPSRRSIRIKLNNDEATRERKQHRKTQSAAPRTKPSEYGQELSAHLKSPTSPHVALTKYPKAPAPPRPLIPRRQPSYINFEPSRKQQKTLILDLDETLIHSMSKGGRLNSGHMVEVRLNTASLGLGGGGSGNAGMAAQHPILYWVNKRPYCDEFLRRVCKWYNLVVFTASVQEYADPVIDWLESERKFFSARYYRQHCTYRQGAYIKDLSSVEPDLSKVMILDNSPLSYLFHEDNAIPIQGWINDPTDNDLMHLVPMLEGLQYVHDVRALLALRGGEDSQSMA
ncbi:NIF domain-containing protein [Cordyceps fumosorosea ARSEF 2679]|uniref:NIF domain-containing protein n=1 Tax=Cordyceps fumosorosea (strain ARSEF 2679) TaxID=1081104 RepID=A0A167PN10_CORFA|nr:NIF domain-containing protein [Cordyceps fumosorosea ARSEF 2679]OAA56839.1 NIF domain-containing protein [Cordyceps fumosorosea ARSEF 2679]